MKSDRELLELAAKAAGYSFKWFKVKQWKKMKSRIGPYRYCNGTIEVYGHHHSKPWNPLADDGDAFRLAVNLGMTIITNGDMHVSAGFLLTNGPIECQSVTAELDKQAATRRAIVIAAASIGCAML